MARKERMEPFGIRITPSLRNEIDADGASRRPKETPSDVAREILEGHYARKKKKRKKL